jgi:hypothetical protein
LSKIDYGKICVRFKEKLGDAFIERIERRIGQDFETAAKENPDKLLSSIIEDVHLYYVLPFEMTLETAEYLKEKYEIEKFSLAMSPEFVLSPTQKMDDIKKFVEQFYSMVKELGFAEKFMRSRTKWWMK